MSRRAASRGAGADSSAAAAAAPAASSIAASAGVKRGRKDSPARKDAHDLDERKDAMDDVEGAAASSASAADLTRAKKKPRAAASPAASKRSLASKRGSAMDDGDDGDDGRGDEDESKESGGGGAEASMEEEAAAAGLSLYEYKRQENIRLKNAQLQALNLAGGALATEIGLKRAAPAKRSTPYKKKPKAEPAVGVRRSTRSMVADPNYVAPPPLYDPDAAVWAPRPDRVSGPVSFKDSMPDDLDDEESKDYNDLLHEFSSALRWGKDATSRTEKAVRDTYGKPHSLAAKSMQMLGEGPRVIKSRCTTLSIHPTHSLTSDRTVLAAADKMGAVSLASYVNEAATPDKWLESFRSAQFQPHNNSIVEVVWTTRDTQALFSASREGCVRRLDVEKEQWSEFWVESEGDDGASASAFHLTPDQSMAWIGDRAGVIHGVDPRSDHGSRGSGKKAAQKLVVGEKSINAINFSPLDSNYFLTGGLDRIVKAWDIRSFKEDRPLNQWGHPDGAINSVCFSPSGQLAVSTSLDNTMKLWCCTASNGSFMSPDKWAKPVIIKHDNHTGRWITRFMARLSPDDRALAVGNMKRAVDIFPLPPLAQASASSKADDDAPAAASSASKKGKGGAAAGAASSSTAQLPPMPLSMYHYNHSEWVTSIPAVTSWHPTRAQLAACTGGGRLYVFGHTGKS